MDGLGLPLSYLNHYGYGRYTHNIYAPMILIAKFVPHNALLDASFIELPAFERNLEGYLIEDACEAFQKVLMVCKTQSG